MLIEHIRLRPQLFHHVRHLPGPVCAARRAGHRPEAPVACDVPQEAVLVVRTAHDDALPRMILHAVAVGVAELVVLPGDERLDRLHVHLLKPRQLAQLQYPLALQLLRRGLVLHVAYGQAVAEPLPAQLGEERTLAHALRAVEHDHAVELDARLVHAGDGRHQHLPRYCAGVGGVRRAQVVHEQRLHSGHAVPRGQRFEVVADGMVTALCGDSQQDALVLCRRVERVHVIEIYQQRPEVGLVPAGLDGRPGQRGSAFRIAPDVDAAAVNVVGDVLEPRVVAQDERQIAQRVLDAALLVHLQLFLPVFVLRRLCFLRVQIAKLLRGLLPALLA